MTGDGDGWADAVAKHTVPWRRREALMWLAVVAIGEAARDKDEHALVLGGAVLRAMCLAETGDPPSPDPSDPDDRHLEDALACLLEHRYWVCERVLHRAWLKWTATR